MVMVMVMLMNDLLPPPLYNVNRPSHSEIQLFRNLTMKILDQHNAYYGPRSRSHLILENSKIKVIAKVKPDGYIWGLKFNQYVCFSFCGNRTILGWDIANYILDLEKSRSRSWPRSNLVVTFDALNSIDMFAFRFVAIGPFGAEI